MSSIPEDLDFLPNGPQGDVLFKFGEEEVSISHFDKPVSFAVSLSEDCFPTNTYGYHFTNIEDPSAVFGRNIENNLPEIFWYSPKKCIVLSDLISASVKANLTIIAPCVVGHGLTFKNIDQIKLIDRVAEELLAFGPRYGSGFGGKVLLNNVHVNTLISEANLILLNQSFIQTLISHNSALELHNEGIINQITMNDGNLFLNNGSALIEHLNVTASSIKLLNTTGTIAGDISLTMNSFENKGPLITTTGNLLLNYNGLDVLQNRELLKSNGRIHIRTVTQFENHGWIEGKNGGHIESMEFINAENAVLMFRDKPLKITVASQNNVLFASASAVFAGSLEITGQNNARIANVICQGCDLTISGVSGENIIKAQEWIMGISGTKSITTEAKNYQWAICNNYQPTTDGDSFPQIVKAVDNYNRKREAITLKSSCVGIVGCIPLCNSYTISEKRVLLYQAQVGNIREPKVIFKSALNIDVGEIRIHGSKIHLKSINFLSPLSKPPFYIAEVISNSLEISNDLLKSVPVHYSARVSLLDTFYLNNNLALFKWEWIAQDFGLNPSTVTVENLGSTHRITQVLEIKEAAIYREDVVDGAILEGMLGLIKQGTLPLLPDVPNNALVSVDERNALANRMHALKLFDFKEQKEWIRTLADGSQIVTSVPDIKLLFRMNGGGFNLEWLPRDLTLMEQENPLALSLISGQMFTEWSVHYLVDIQSKYKPYLLKDDAGNEYFDQVAFLKSLGLEYDKGILPISMNSFMLEQLLDRAIVETVGVLTGESTSETLRLFANNAFNQYKTGNIGLKAGQFLTDLQISLLEEPMIWPVFTNCWSGNAVVPCLSYQIYFNNRIIEDIVDDATGLVLSGRVLDLRVDQIVIPWLVKLKGTEQVKLSVDKHVIILGSLEGQDVNAQIKGEFINLGKVKSTKDIAINAATIFLTNKVQAGERLTIYAVEDLLIETLTELATIISPYLGYRSTEQKVTVRATIESGTEAVFQSGKNTLITGAKVIGNKVLLQSGGKTAVVHLELYLEIIKWGHRFYNEYQRVTPFLSEFICGTGSCDIESQGDVTVIGPNFKGKGEATWKSISGTINVEAASIREKSFSVTQGRKWLFGKTKRTERTFFETPVQSIIDFAGSFLTQSYESQRWIGVHIKAKQVQLVAGTPEHAASISMLPSYKMSEIEVHTRSRSIKLGFEKSRVTFAEITKSGQAKKLATPFPTIIQVEEKFIVYANGKFLYLQPHIDYIEETDENGKIKIIITAKDIELEAAPEIEAEYNYLNRAGNGIGLKASGGEFVIKSSVFHEKSKESWLKIRHPIAPIVRGFVEFHGDTIKDAGIYYFAEEMNLHSRIEIHTVVSDVETRKCVDSLFEAGMKFGIRSNVVSIKNTAQAITKDDHGSVEGVISSAFRGWKLYHDILKLFSSNANFGISGGLWFFVHGEYSKSESRAVNERPSVLNVTKLNSTSDELSFKGTQVTAYEAYIETKYAKSDAAKSTYDASNRRYSFDLDIPLYGNIPASLSAEISKGKVKIERNLRTQIYVSGRCKLNVEIKADLKGFFLSARELEANFNDLILESLQDIIESKAWSAGVGLGLNGKDMPKLDNIKGNLQDRNRHVVESLSAILGGDPEKTKIVVANALRLNGAIVANAEKDENGQYTDRGNLVLTVGYLFIKHIYDYDTGKTLSASFSKGSDIKLHDQKGNEIPFMSLEATLAGHDKDGWTYATIGKGNVEVTQNSEGLKEANRDITKPQNFETNYEVKETHLYYSNIDTKALKVGIPSSAGKWGQGVSNQITDTLGITTSVQEDQQEEIEESDELEEYVSNNQDSAIRSIVFLDADNDNNNDYDIGFSVAPETESKLKIIGKKIGKLIAEYNLEVATQHAEGRRWFDDANVIGAIGYIWGAVYSDLKKSIPKEIKGLTAAIMALEDMSNNLEPNKDPMKIFNGLIEKNRQSLDKANGISPIFEGIAKHTKSAYSSAVTEIKDITATMMALEGMSTKVSQDTEPMEVFTMLVDQNRKALDNANGIAPIFQGIAAGLNYVTEGIASPTREVIEDVSILVGGFEAGKLTYQSGRFIFRETAKTSSKILGNLEIQLLKRGELRAFADELPLSSSAKESLANRRGDLIKYAKIKKLEEVALRNKEIQYEPSFTEGKKAFIMPLQEGDEFVRLMLEKSPKAGNWLGLKKDIIGLTPKQMKEEFALKYEPTHYIEMKVTNPTRNHKVIVGEVAPNFGEKGGGTQFFLAFEIKPKDEKISDWFQNKKPIPEDGIK